MVYQDGGNIMDCSDCHPGNTGNSFYQVAGMEFLDCMDCHMPFMGKSAVAFNASMGDISGHLFRITTDAIAAEDNVTDIDGTLYWNQDMDGESFTTLDYSCLGCHIDVGDGLTLEAAAAYALNMHTDHAACLADLNGDGQVNGGDLGPAARQLGR